MKVSRALLFGLVLLAFALRVYRLDAQNLWHDEGYSVYRVFVDFSEWLEEQRYHDHPPFYFLLLKLWGHLTGLSSFALRYFSVLAGVLSIPLIAQAGRLLGGTWVGLTAATLLTLSPFALHHSQEVRMYTLLPAIALASWYVLLRAVRPLDPQREKRGISWLYPLTVAMAVGVHYYGAFLPVAQGLFLLAGREWRALILPWLRATLLAGGLTLLWFAPLAYGTFAAVANKVGLEKHEPWPPVPYVGHYLRTELFGYGRGTDYALVAGAVLLGASAVAALALGGKEGGPPIGRGLFTALAGTVAVGWLANYLVPFPEFPRLLSSTFPLLLLFIGWALVTLSRLRWGMPLVGLALLVSAWLPFLHDHYFRPHGDFLKDWRDEGEHWNVAARLRELLLPGDRIVLDLPWQAGFLASYEPSLRPYLVVLPPLSPTGSDERRVQRLHEVASEAQRVWYPAWEAVGGTESLGVRPFLRQRTPELLGEWYGLTRLFLFDLRAPLAPLEAPAVQLGAEFGGKVRLRGFTLGRAEYARGDIAPLVLFWEALAPLPPYTVFVHLTDAQDRLVATADGVPDLERRPTDHWALGEVVADPHAVVLPQSLPPGQYRLYVGLYDPATGVRLNAPASHPEGLFLTEITVR